MLKQTMMAAQTRHSSTEHREILVFRPKHRAVTPRALVLHLFTLSAAMILSFWLRLGMHKRADNNVDGGMEGWHPATIAEIQRFVEKTLRICDGEQLTAFKQFTVTPFIAPITRYGKSETAVVVARNGDEVIYYEDIDEGFNVSPISPDGVILEHWCNQDDLGSALNTWIEGRVAGSKSKPSAFRNSSVLKERRESMILERLWITETLSRQTY